MSDNISKEIESCTDCERPINPIEGHFVYYNLISAGRTITEDCFCDDRCLMHYLERTDK